MSISRNIYELADRVQKFVNRKSFKVAFVGFSTFALFLGTFNTYAAGPLEPAFDASKKVVNLLSGAIEGETNVVSGLDVQSMGSLWYWIVKIAPKLTKFSSVVMEDDSIPYSAKAGLLDVTEDAATMAYQVYPTADVPSHLAQMWVPGYDESVSSAYAADEDGYTTLRNSGIVGLWSKMLNISYVIFVIIMIAAGFMIMFRHKLGGQTMVTIGNVLPNVIISLLLATFSFAIAGLIIDFGGLLVSLIADIYSGEQVNISSLSSLLFGALTGQPSVGSLLESIVSKDGGVLNLLGTITVLAALFTNPIGIVGMIFLLVVMGIILVGAFKVIIALYKAYFTLLINVIIGPIQITAGAIPGNSNMIKNWFLSILRNVLVFPMVFAIVNLPSAIIADNPEANLNFPDKLTYGQSGVIEFFGGVNAANGFFLLILRIFILYFAAQAPKFLEAWFPPDTNKNIAEGINNAKASLAKIPVLGGLFK